jgi:hypothetical protein
MAPGKRRHQPLDPQQPRCRDKASGACYFRVAHSRRLTIGAIDERASLFLGFRVLRVARHIPCVFLSSPARKARPVRYEGWTADIGFCRGGGRMAQTYGSAVRGRCLMKTPHFQGRSGESSNKRGSRIVNLPESPLKRCATCGCGFQPVHLWHELCRQCRSYNRISHSYPRFSTAICP